MKKIVLILCCTLISLMATATSVYTVKNTPNIHLTDLTKYTTDPNQILSPETVSRIDQILYQLDQKTGIEVAVVVLPSIGETDCFSFSHQLFKEWGVGKKGINNGLLILLVTDQRCVQFYTGYGLEGDLPDAIAKRIQYQKMIPYLKNNQWDEGVLSGVEAVYDRLHESMERGASETTSNYLIIALFLGSFLLFIGISIYARYQSLKCPKCKKSKLQRSNSEVVKVTPTVKQEKVTYICRNCGNVVTRIENNYRNNSNNRGGGGFGPIIGGPTLGRGFGGGTRGGGFGGGLGGGGGAGSRF